jgi:hypothetical protein
VDPTGEHAADARRERSRNEVRKVATQVREARNLLYVGRRTLRERTQSTTIQQTKPDPKALISAEDLTESLGKAQEREAS